MDCPWDKDVTSSFQEIEPCLNGLQHTQVIHPDLTLYEQAFPDVFLEFVGATEEDASTYLKALGSSQKNQERSNHQIRRGKKSDKLLLRNPITKIRFRNYRSATTTYMINDRGYNAFSRKPKQIQRSCALSRDNACNGEGSEGNFIHHEGMGNNYKIMRIEELIYVMEFHFECGKDHPFI